MYIKVKIKLTPLLVSCQGIHNEELASTRVNYQVRGYFGIGLVKYIIYTYIYKLCLSFFVFEWKPSNVYDWKHKYGLKNT